MITEIWRDIKGYEGRYQVSNHGRVRSVEMHTRNSVASFIRKGKMISIKKDNNGYPIVTFCVNDKTSRHRVHRLVADAFIPNPDNKKEVNHIDGDKSNNIVTNLEWNTYAENIIHALDKGLNKRRKMVEQIDPDNGQIIKIWTCGYEATRAMGGSSPTAITNAIAGRSKTAYGYIWKHHIEE